MKIDSPLSFFPGCAIAFLLSVSFACAQTVISVNFQGTNPTALGAGDVTGVASAGNWNNLAGGSGSNVALNDSLGLPSGVTLTSFGSTGLGEPNGPFGPNNTPQSSLIGGGLGVNWGEASFTLSGLNAFSSYNVIVYYSGGDSFPFTRNASFSSSQSGTVFYIAGINSQYTTFTQSTSTTSGSPSEGNYVLYSGLTNATQTLTMTFVDNSMTLSGFQIVGTAIPEPGAWVLVTMGGMMGLLLRRRKSATRAG